MFFPYNIDNQIKKTKKADKKDITSIVMFCLSVLGFFLFRFLVSLGILPWWLCLIFTILVLLAISTFILIIFVYRGRELVEEDEESKVDSLERFYKIVETELPTIVDGIEVFENIDGNMCACLELLYGPNDKVKSDNTLKFLVSLFNSVSKFCIDFKVYVTKEDFLRSIECKRFLNTVNSVKDPTLASVIAEMSDLILGYTETKSNLYSTYIIIRFTPANISNLNGLKVQLLESLNNSNSSVRNIEFSDRKRFRSFIREYYRVEALDLSSFRGGKLTNRLIKKYGRNIFVVKKNNIRYKFNTGVKEL